MRNSHNKKKLQKKPKVKDCFTIAVFRIWWFDDAVQWHLLLFYYRSKIKLMNLNEDEIDSLIRIFIIKRIRISNVPADYNLLIFFFFFFLFIFSKTLAELKTPTTMKRDLVYSLPKKFAKLVSQQWFDCNAKNIGPFYFKSIIVQLTKILSEIKKIRMVSIGICEKTICILDFVDFHIGSLAIFWFYFT